MQAIKDAKWFIEESMKFMSKPRWWILLHPHKIVGFCINCHNERKRINKGDI